MSMQTERVMSVTVFIPIGGELLVDDAAVAAAREKAAEEDGSEEDAEDAGAKNAGKKDAGKTSGGPVEDDRDVSMRAVRAVIDIDAQKHLKKYRQCNYFCDAKVKDMLVLMYPEDVGVCKKLQHGKVHWYGNPANGEGPQQVMGIFEPLNRVCRREPKCSPAQQAVNKRETAKLETKRKRAKGKKNAATDNDPCNCFMPWVDNVDSDTAVYAAKFRLHDRGLPPKVIEILKGERRFKWNWVTDAPPRPLVSSDEEEDEEKEPDEETPTGALPARPPPRAARVVAEGKIQEIVGSGSEDDGDELSSASLESDQSGDLTD